ncbi:MAG: SDR family NAD(P)-dependent oxidoreductase [Candidatus Omnitrophota bacterium]
MKVLVTGGAGFIGSHLVDLLVKEGFTVRILDNLESQVHQGRKPDYLNRKAEFFRGDVRNRGQLQKSIKGCEAIFHLAARVGVGQSQYQIKRYVETNIGGTANLFDILANEKHQVTKVIVAASMSGYGEGVYRCRRCGPIKPDLRPEKQLAGKKWEPTCPKCKVPLKPLPTPESTPLKSNSIYALTKKVQEEMSLIFGHTYRIPTVVLRFFNVYGPRQSLSNPYTGVAAIFLSRLKNDQPPIIYEDGGQTRDFVFVSDVCQALSRCLKKEAANYEIFNVGSGCPLKIADIARTLAHSLNKRIEPQITGKFRKGDVRHCFADIGKIKEKVGWRPEVRFEEGIKNLISWAMDTPAEDKFLQAQAELVQKGLL